MGKRERERERAGCFILFVFLMSRYCFVAVPQDATGCLQFVMVLFLDHTHLLLLNKQQQNRRLRKGSG